MPKQLLCLLICLIFIVPINLVAQTSPAPIASTIVQIKGLRESVTVRRDARGIPYIEAATEDDLYFAQGYVTASDRLWQMDLLRRTGRGELAEIFGRAALEEDKRRRIYGFARLAEEMERDAAPQLRRVLEAYAGGVNAYINSLDAKILPAEFRLLGYKPRAWRPADSLVIGKIFSEILTRPWTADVQRAALFDIAPDKLRALTNDQSPLDVIVVGSDNVKRQSKFMTKTMAQISSSSRLFQQLAQIEQTMERSHRRVGLHAEDLAASNNWVVSGKRTTSGKPMLANDPHLSASAPGIWYMTHLSAPDLRVAGVTAPGAPGIIIGHNEHIAWGVTNLGPDVQDVYVETFDAKNPRMYKTPQGWREAQTRREEIKVRKSSTDANTEIVPHDVTVTRHGPVVLEREGNRYALKWTALDPNAIEFTAFYTINRARNWREFTNALATYKGAMQNFVYADRENNIGYYGAGQVPIRQTGDGSLPYDGASDAGEWTGLIPFAELPHIFNPPSGLIVTANNRVVGRSYKNHLTNDWAAPYRARRIYDLLDAKSKLSMDDFQKIQADVYSIGGKFFANETFNILNKAATTGDATRDKNALPHLTLALKLLANWNGEVTPESRAAAFVSTMRTAFRERVVAGVVGAERAENYRGANVENFADMVLKTQAREWLPNGFSSYAQLLEACARDAYEQLGKQLGADETKWTWGAISQVRFPHPLAQVPIFGTPFVIQPFAQRGSGFSAGATVNVGANVSMRLIIDASDWNKTRQNIAPGQSGNPASPHWKDQLESWKTVTPPTFPFTPDAVRQAMQSNIVLAPPKR